VKADRLLAGYTQEELAELSGLEKVTLAIYERGEVVPSVESAVNIASVLGYYVDRYLKMEMFE
jgi:transcriptional regulator with XRE-family HTH domain